MSRCPIFYYTVIHLSLVEKETFIVVNEQSINPNIQINTFSEVEIMRKPAPGIFLTLGARTIREVTKGKRMKTNNTSSKFHQLTKIKQALAKIWKKKSKSSWGWDRKTKISFITCVTTGNVL